MIELLLVAERLLAEGEIDRAEHLLEQVAEADPRNAIAVVGLAQVAQLRGDAAGAIRLATRALEIDPEDAAAQRLVAELEPVAGPEAGLEPIPAATVEPERALEAADQPAATPAPEPEPEPVAAAVPEPALEPADQPAPAATAHRRSWLDRLLRFLRLR